MNQQQFDELIGAFGQGWVDRDPEAVMALIARDGLVYYESTFEGPTNNWNRVNELWHIVPENQKDVTWWHEVLVCDSQKALAHVKVTRTMVPSGERQDIDAAFLFGVDAAGKINYFRQWRMLRG